KKILTCIVLILLFSTINTISFGKDSKKTEQNKQLDDLAFYCTTTYSFNEIKYDYYKEQLLKQDSNENIKEQEIADSEELITIQNPPSMVLFDGPMDSAWPMQSHDLHHTGRSPYSTADNPGIEKWRFYFSGWLEDTPVIDSDWIIYCKGAFNALDRYLYAIYPNGTEKWKFKTDGLILGSSPAIDEDGTIYVGSWDHYLYAINPNGTLKWKFLANDANIASSPAIGEDGTIYFGTLWSLGDGGKIHAVNPNGTEKWRYQTGDAVSSAPAIGNDGTIYIGSYDTYLYAMNPDGTLKWRFKTGHYIKGPSSIADDGTIYIGSWDDYLYALYPNGTMKWKYKIGAGTETNPSIAYDGTIYVGSYDGHLYNVYPNGTLKWSFAVIGNIHQSSPAISADGTIYFGTDDSGYIYAVNPDGTEKWRKQIAQNWVESSPSIAEDGTIYIGSSCSYGRGYLHAFGNIETNSPPNAPNISGPTNVNVGDKNWYIFTAVDPDNNPIQLFVDWGDDTIGWVGEYASGEQMWLEHAWNTKGTYMVKAKVKDVMNEESGWGYLEVMVPRVKNFRFNLFLRFLERFPLLQKLLSFFA
ncbi:MAG: PQQ-binding-like beta-propeller repeat protein, partial [Candidatus Thermoplasmatota archaeon]|nr:PQQ-binding-like beta-propeller repeat protein [Candidatus Thermoplasmatota archaeon]